MEIDTWSLVMPKELASFVLESLGHLAVTLISLAMNHAVLLAGGPETLAIWQVSYPGIFLGLGAVNLLGAALINNAVPGTALNWMLGFVLAIAETTILVHLLCGGVGGCV